MTTSEAATAIYDVKIDDVEFVIGKDGTTWTYLIIRDQKTHRVTREVFLTAVKLAEIAQRQKELKYARDWAAAEGLGSGGQNGG